MKFSDSFMAHMSVNVMITDMGMADETIATGRILPIKTKAIIMQARRGYNAVTGMTAIDPSRIITAIRIFLSS
jgi:hypothetical protein